LNYTREVRGFHHSTVGWFFESPFPGRGMVVVSDVVEGPHPHH